jgi:hypothetical protein
MNETLSSILVIAVLLAFGAMLVYVLREAVKWCCEDAKFRGKDPFWVCFGVILLFPWGLVAWLLMRPAPAVGYVRKVHRK